MALYAHGNYDDAVKSLLRAADLNPADPSCYLFLSRAYDSSPSQADDVIQRFRRFSELQPSNARALYYYAMSLWKGKRAQDPSLDLHQIESLLKKSIELDPKLAEAHLQLGNLYSDQSKYAEAIPEYVRALTGSRSWRRPLPPGAGLCPHGAEGPRPGAVSGLSEAPRTEPGRDRKTKGGDSSIRLRGEGHPIGQALIARPASRWRLGGSGACI